MVNTFVPYADMRFSLDALDSERLGKQRSEIKIILAALTGVRFKKWKGEFALELPEKRGYRNHSATRMWAGHEYQLAQFGRLNCEIWAERFGHEIAEGAVGYDTWQDMADWQAWLYDQGANDSLPEWWGREDVHSSHRQVLLFKDPEFYAQYGWTEEARYEYVWPR